MANPDGVGPQEDDSFHEWLGKHRQGELSDELQQELARVLDAVRLTRKGGSLTLQIEFKPQGRSLVVTDNIKVKIPEADRESAIYFDDGDGHLVRHDPMIPALPFAEQQDTPAGVTRLGRRDRTGEVEDGQ